MHVSSKEIDAMADLLAVMEGRAPAAVAAEGTGGAPNAASAVSEIDAMKKILEGFYSATEDAQPVIEDRAVREAIVTSKTQSGARVGSWEIVINEGSVRTFDVVNVVTREPIAAGLYLYDACVSLVSRLNEGVGITDSRVRDILLLEEDYARNRNNAEHFKQTYRSASKRGDDTRAAIAEDRYDEARDKALDAHDRILKLAGLKR